MRPADGTPSVTGAPRVHTGGRYPSRLLIPAPRRSTALTASRPESITCRSAFTGKTAVVGASRGIGLGIARRLVDDIRARVVITARNPDLDEAVAELGGPRCGRCRRFGRRHGAPGRGGPGRPGHVRQPGSDAAGLVNNIRARTMADGDHGGAGPLIGLDAADAISPRPSRPTVASRPWSNWIRGGTTYRWWMGDHGRAGRQRVVGGGGPCA